MNKNARDKIVLKKETVRTLVGAHLDSVVGGQPNPTRSVCRADTCPATGMMNPTISGCLLDNCA